MTPARFSILVAICLTVIAPAAPVFATPAFVVTALLSDDATAHPAPATDPNLVDPWGIASGPDQAFWIAVRGSGNVSVHGVDPETQATGPGWPVFAPGGPSPVTGMAHSTTRATYHGDPFIFLFVSESGGSYGWREVFGQFAEDVRMPADDAGYTGAAFGAFSGSSYLYAADFRAGEIDVLASDEAEPFPDGRFSDPDLPDGYAPYGIANLGGALYVSYAVRGAGETDEVPGPGNGVVNRFDLQGNLLGRVAEGGALNSPWGLAIAPPTFGEFAGQLLIGSSGDGTISVYDVESGAFLGQLSDAGGDPLVIDGLRGLAPGNDQFAGNSGALYFTAGPDGGMHGVLGAIEAVPEPEGLALLGAAALALAARRRTG
jgi:uncharacterized protein (TIGR03118 family)